MSEYQHLYFAAIDKPLDDKQLAYMERQSTRAEISRWRFTNEYHFGDFHGNAWGMMRRGYDVHLHYANFGIRRLMFRLPGGLPWETESFNAFFTDEGVTWQADKKGPGGILMFDPEADAGTYDEEFFEFEDLEAQLGRMREMLLSGDIRPLYLAWLGCVGDPDAIEPPVPAGLAECLKELGSMARFYEVSTDLIKAAAERSPTAPKRSGKQPSYRPWIDQQSTADLRDLLERMLTDDTGRVRAEILAGMRKPTTQWPTAEPTRTLAKLHEAAERQQSRCIKKEASQKKQARKKRLTAIANDPKKTIAAIKKRVKRRSTIEYKLAAQELLDLSEALGPKRGPQQAQSVAKQLARENPTLNCLKAALRKRGLLPKP